MIRLPIDLSARRAAVLTAGLLLAGTTHAAPIAVLQSPFGGIVTSIALAGVDSTSLAGKLTVRGVDQFSGPVSVGQTVVASVTSGTVFDEIVALYTNGVPDVTNLFSIAYSFDVFLQNGTTTPAGGSFSVSTELPDLPDLSGYVIEEFRLTSTLTCWDQDASPGKDNCSLPAQGPTVGFLAQMKAEFFGHLEQTAVPEPGSGALVAAALLGLAGVRRQRA